MEVNFYRGFHWNLVFFPLKMFLSVLNFHLYSLSFFQVEKQCQGLKEFYQTDILRKEEGGAEARHWSDSGEKQWQLFLKRSFLTHDLGLEFLNLINMVRMTLNESHLLRGLLVKVKFINSKFQLSFSQTGLRSSFQLHSPANSPEAQHFSASLVLDPL